MNKGIRILSTGFFVLLFSEIQAHPGHGEHADGFSVIHYFTEPVHVAVMAVVLFSVIVAWKVRRQTQDKRAD